LHTTQINPTLEYFGSIWLMGLVRSLPFNPKEWRWKAIHPLKEVDFFSYSTCHGYRIALTFKPQLSRFCKKQEVMGLKEDESALSIKLTWNKNKPAKLQFFLWQANSRGLPTGSWCVVMGFLGNYACCRRGPIETPEHYLSNCNTARRVWRKLSNVWRDLGMSDSFTCTRRKTGINDFINVYNLYHLGHLQSFNMSCLGHLQSSLSRPSDWKTTTGRCTSMLIQKMASVVVFELHRTCSHSLSGCIGHGFPLVLARDSHGHPSRYFESPSTRAPMLVGDLLRSAVLWQI
jgi:hypothetical protein